MAVAGLALYRKFVALHENDLIHVSEGESKMIPQQIEMAQRLDLIDRWGKILTVVAAAGGLVLGGVYLYLLWQESLRPVG